MIPRKYQNTRTYSDPDANLVYMHCQMKANYRPVVVRGVKLKRGQFLISVEKFGHECGMNESKMRRILKLLESEGLIVRKSAGKVTDKVTEKPTDKTTKSGTVITVVNYGVQGHDNNQDDEETDEETDEECDGQTDDSIIKKKEYRTSNNREICVKENLVNLVEPAKAKASTRQTRPSFDNSRIAKISAGLHERGYQHTGHGAGGEYGLIGSLLKQGYTEEQLLSAAEIAAESKENRPDHIDDYTAFLVSILRDQFGTGSDDVPCVIRDESIPDWD